MFVGARLFKISKTETLATIVLERILDFSMIALLFGDALMGGGEISDKLVYAGYVLVVITIVAWALIFVALRYEQPALRYIGWALPAHADEYIERMVLLVLKVMHSMKSTQLVIRSVLLSLLQWALVGLAIYAALQSVRVEINMAAVVVTLAATMLAVSLPAAPGFFGTIQLAYVLALIPYGVSENDALAGSIIFHVISYS